MYKKLADDRTKEYYSKLLLETLTLAEKRLSSEKSLIWISVVNQLKDIQEKVIEKYIFSDWEEVYDRYTLGTIAISEIQEEDEMQNRLSEIFWGAVHYRELAAE